MESSYWARMMRARVARRRLLAGAGAAGLAGVIVACGGGGDGGTSGEPESRTDEDPGPPKYGGTLKIGYSGASITNFDPHFGASGAEHQFFFAICDPIVGYDQKGQLDASLSLAEKWELPEPTRVTLKLRSGIKFHDGAEFSADDVKWNLERIIDPSSGATPRSDLASIDSVQVVNKNEVVIRLKEPSAPLLTNFGDRGGQILSRTSFEKVGKDGFRRSPVGTGPFILKQWVDDAYLVYEANPNYWRKDARGNKLPYLQTIRVELIPDATVRTAAFEAGDVDVVIGVPATEEKRLASDRNYQVVKFNGSGTTIWYMNHAFPPLDNVWFRRALSSALDRESYIKNFLTGEEQIATGFATPASWAHDATIQNYNFDIAKAKEYLQRSGLPQSQWRVRTQPFGATISDAELFWQTSAKEAGITIDYAEPERDGWQKRVLKGLGGDGSAGMYFSGLSLRVDPDGHLGLIYTQKGAYNSGQAPLPEVEPLIIKAKQTYDLNERKSIYSEAQKKAVENVYSAFLVTYGIARGFARKNVGNFRAWFGGEGKPRFANLWV
ncbi:MAG TPA: ABC transporter substrate-binding protein [Dehalococcoidia bacterium]|nr:ABC transporter substrate-binding protein [Dehalococcoidia bacterium]